MLQWECKRREIPFCFQSKLLELKVKLEGSRRVCVITTAWKEEKKWPLGEGYLDGVGTETQDWMPDGVERRHRPGGKGAVVMSRDQTQTVSAKPSHS